MARQRAKQSLPFIPHQIFSQISRGGTSAQQGALNKVIMDQLGPWMSGDETKKVSFRVNNHTVRLERTASQVGRQRAIEASQKKIMDKHLEAARKGRTVRGEDGRRHKYPKPRMDDPAQRRQVLADARQNAIDEITRLHKHNLDALEHQSNPKIQSMIKNLKAELQGGTRTTHEGRQEKKEQIAGKRRKHLIMVNSPEQAAAVQAALKSNGIEFRSMAASIKDQAEHLTGDVRSLKKRGRLTDDEVKRRRDEWKKDADKIDDTTGAYVKGKNKIPVVIIDQNSAAGHNLQEADTMHVVGAPEDAATLLQAHGRGARDPRIADQLDIYEYRHSDSPFEHAQWDTIEKQTDMLRATSPGAVEKPEYQPELRRMQQKRTREAQLKAESKKPQRARKGLYLRGALLNSGAQHG
jgi:hypothetical protein